jgi:hypothetical protein
VRLPGLNEKLPSPSLNIHKTCGKLHLDILAALEPLHLTVRHQQHVHKQSFDLIQKLPPKVGNRIGVGVAITGQKPKRKRFIGGALELAAAEDPVGQLMRQS